MLFVRVFCHANSETLVDAPELSVLWRKRPKGRLVGLDSLTNIAGYLGIAGHTKGVRLMEPR